MSRVDMSEHNTPILPEESDSTHAVSHISEPIFNEWGASIPVIITPIEYHFITSDSPDDDTLSDDQTQIESENLCCVCMDNEGCDTNFSYWSCTGHNEKICNDCTYRILGQRPVMAVCPICRSPPKWKRISRENCHSYIQLEMRRNNFIVNPSIRTLIINYVFF